jgi:serine/threonine-protein kinase
MPLVPGKTLTHFVVLDILGAGAMGEVYRAKDTRLDREVAIKLLPEHFAKDAERRKRFEREAKSLASLNHPNIAQIYAVDQDEDSYFLALELVPGETVEDRLRRGPLPLDEALDIGRQIAEGLEAAHEAGVIHRDLKPANIRVTPEGKVKLLDFGLAKPVREGAGTSSSDSVLSTEQGRLLGTPTYMAPEQARGRAIDKRVDLWAFGCVLYECLTARRAFGGETLSDVIANVIENEPDWSRLPPLPTRVRELIERCLTKDLAHRQRGAGDAALALEVARREGPSLRAAAPRRAGATVGWLVAAVACATAVWLQLRSGSEPSRAVATARETRFELALPPDTRLCPSDRANNEVAVSADGTRIAYVVEDGENTAIWTRALGQLEPKRLDLGKDVRGPTFSPDGKWMAYTQGFRHLMRVPVDGGPPERMVTLRFTKDAAWLADGTWACADQDQLHILECDLALGTTRVLATAAAGFEGFENVVASPDPSWLLADGWKGLGVTDYRVFAVDRASGAVEVLIENAASPAVVGEDILVFQRGAALYATRFDFRTRRPLGEPRMVQAGVSTDRWGGSTQFAVSRTGTLVYAPGSRRGEGRRLVWKSADGSVEPIRAEPDAFSQGLDLSVAGRMVIVRTLRDREQLWSIDLIGKSMAPVVAGELTCAVLTSQGDAVVYCIRTAVGYELLHAP